MKIFTFKVAVIVDDEVTENQLRVYIRDAVRCHGGSFSPDDPLFGLNARDIQVKRLITPALRAV